MTTLALIGCSSRKLDRAAPARELYTGNLFKLSVRYAEKRGLQWCVLSAKHGLVTPGFVMEPYDVTLAKKTAAERSAWGARVAIDLSRLFGPDLSIVFLAGMAYWAAVSSFPDQAVEQPLQGLEIGDRMAWLKRELARP